MATCMQLKPSPTPTPILSQKKKKKKKNKIKKKKKKKKSGEIVCNISVTCFAHRLKFVPFGLLGCTVY